MIKQYDIYINGIIAFENVSIDEKAATVEYLIKCLSAENAGAYCKSLLKKIEDGASIEILEQGELDEYEDMLDENN